MRRESPPSFLWLALALVLPLAVLVAVAGHGMQAQLKAARAEAREEAERLAPLLADSLTRELEAGMATISTYQDPPLPGAPSELDAVLDGSDPTALEELRDNPDAGLSPAGLPRRALAALRLQVIDRSRQSKQSITDLLIRDAPSSLTAIALERLPAMEVDRAKWRETEELRRLAKQSRNPDGEWIDRGNRLSFVRPGDGRLSHVSIERATWAESENRRGLPPWAFAHVFRSASEWPVLATAPIGLGTGLVLGISPLNNGSLIEAPIRRQQRWTAAILTTAVAVAAIALFFIHRTLRRERQLNEMKSQFVASVSHELRAPVASIRLMADALEEGKLAPETAKEFHRLIAREGARLSTLVGNVLDHARIEQGRRVWKMEATDLAALTADTLRVMQPLAAEKQIALSSRLDPVEAAVDAGAIQQALVNLLDNAIKFSPPSSAVSVTLSIHENRRTCELRVSDEGPGVPRAEQSRIFERFYRPGDELRRETQGTGIGLSLVKSIAEAHRGTIAVESEPGRGSIFILRIPLGA
ncbi:sensor histidine kinase [Luteolibacter sp. Populi]|uniref:sensor histidine kinase n=1 Tax=Luteolibacter sp. Populi TaxID=3230487 RepID=UPI0034661253